MEQKRDAAEITRINISNIFWTDENGMYERFSVI
jgi:hypothetical protein